MICRPVVLLLPVYLIGGLSTRGKCEGSGQMYRRYDDADAKHCFSSIRYGGQVEPRAIAVQRAKWPARQEVVIGVPQVAAAAAVLVFLDAEGVSEDRRAVSLSVFISISSMRRHRNGGLRCHSNYSASSKSRSCGYERRVGMRTCQSEVKSLDIEVETSLENVL